MVYVVSNLGCMGLYRGATLRIYAFLSILRLGCDDGRERLAIGILPQLAFADIRVGNH